MTESELREKIAGLVENESSEAHLRSKNRRRLRRVRDIQKSDGLLHIINYGNHATHRRYIDWGFDGRTLLHTGKYIKYPKNSRSQSWIKLETSRRIRSCRNAPAKGNFYRRLFDYIVIANYLWRRGVKLRKSYEYNVKPCITAKLSCNMQKTAWRSS